MNEELVFRWILAATLVLSLGISGYHRRRARTGGETIARSREGGGLIALRVGIGLPMLTVLLVHVIRPVLIPQWLRMPIPSSIRWTGAGLALLCVPSVWWVVSSLGTNISETVLTKRDHQLVSTGPYRWVRHPLYSTGLLLLGSASLLTASWLLLAVTIGVGLGIRFAVIPAEEQALIEKFGGGYREYAARTGRLLPRVP